MVETILVLVRTVKIVVRTTSTSESTGFKTRLSKTFRITEKLNLTCLIQLIHQSGGVQVAYFFENFLN